MEQKTASAGMDAFIVSQKPPRRDERLTLDLLETIARATEGGQPVKSSELETMQGWTPEQVKRELKLLWEEGQIRGIDMKSYANPVSMIIHDLSPAGWARLEQLHQRYRSPVRWRLKQSWPAVERWLLQPVVQIAVAVATLALVALLGLG